MYSRKTLFIKNLFLFVAFKKELRTYIFRNISYQLTKNNYLFLISVLIIQQKLLYINLLKMYLINLIYLIN